MKKQAAARDLLRKQRKEADVNTMKKEEIYQYLNDHGIAFEVTEHQPIATWEELIRIELPHPEAEAKNLFVRDDKKRNYYVITVNGDKRVDLKEFRKAHGLRPLSFASSDDLMTMLQLTPGEVTPLGLLNDSACKIALFLDNAFKDKLIGIHPNDNTATVWMKTDDLVRIIRAHGNIVEFVEIE